MQETFNPTPSHFLTEAFEDISRTFTDVEILSTSEMNVVAKAKRYGRWWLLKGLSQEAAGKTLCQQQLRKELEILMLMQHPAVVTTYGMEEVAPLGRCIVMEYVDGVTLDSWQQQTDKSRRRRAARKLTEAVAYIHSKGIAHRDLKPQNILVTRNGEQVKLIDFGLADTDSHAVLKQPAGTLYYMSPEQQQGSVADGRNDIYSLGVIFSQMRLGWTYSSIIRRCLLPIGQRYQHADELLREMTAREQWGKRMFIAVWVLLLVALTTWSAWLVLRARGLERDYDEMTQAQEQKIEAQQEQLLQMSDSLQMLRGAQQQMQERQTQADEKAQRIREAISEGRKLIDVANAGSLIDSHLDTLSNLKYIWPDFQYKSFAGNRAWHEYCEGLRGRFSQQEMNGIIQAMVLHEAKWQEKWNKKINSIKKP